jgi:hypothetical protein
VTGIKLGFIAAALAAFGGAYFTADQQAVSTALVGFATWLVGRVQTEVGAKE